MFPFNLSDSARMRVLLVRRPGKLEACHDTQASMTGKIFNVPKSIGFPFEHSDEDLAGISPELAFRTGRYVLCGGLRLAVILVRLF